MGYEFKKSEENKENVVADTEVSLETDVEEIKNKVEEELKNLEINGAELVDTVNSIGDEEKLKEMLENDKEKSGNIFKQVRNIILIVGAISAIPMAYSIVNPEALNKFKEAADNYAAIALGVIGTVPAIYLLVEGIRTGELVKGIKELFTEYKEIYNIESFKKRKEERKEERRKKDEWYNRHMKRNFEE